MALLSLAQGREAVGGHGDGGQPPQPLPTGIPPQPSAPFTAGGSSSIFSSLGPGSQGWESSCSVASSLKSQPEWASGSCTGLLRMSFFSPGSSRNCRDGRGDAQHWPGGTKATRPGPAHIVLLQHPQDLLRLLVRLPLLLLDVDDVGRAKVRHVHCLVPGACWGEGSSPGVSPELGGTAPRHTHTPPGRRGQLPLPFFFIISAGPCSKMEWDWITSGRPRPRPCPSRCRSRSRSFFSFLTETSSLGLGSGEVAGHPCPPPPSWQQVSISGRVLPTETPPCRYPPAKPPPHPRETLTRPLTLP